MKRAIRLSKFHTKFEIEFFARYKQAIIAFWGMKKKKVFSHTSLDMVTMQESLIENYY